MRSESTASARNNEAGEIDWLRVLFLGLLGIYVLGVAIGIPFLFLAT